MFAHSGGERGGLHGGKEVSVFFFIFLFVYPSWVKLGAKPLVNNKEQILTFKVHLQYS